MIEVVICSIGQKKFYRRAVQSIRNQKSCLQGCFISPVVTLFCVDRERAILQSSADWILFLDEDCTLPDSSYLQRLEHLITEHPHVAIWGGLYASSKYERYLTRAYNSLCNFWVLWSRSQNEVLNLLSGCIAVHVPTAKYHLTPASHNSTSHKKFHEDVLLDTLQHLEVPCCLSKNLSVLHQPQNQSFQNLWQKAQLHRRQREYYGLSSPPFSIDGLLYAFRNLVYWPVWILHFIALASTTTEVRTFQSNKAQV